MSYQRPRLPSGAQLLRQCSKWNRRWPIGTEVRYYPVLGCPQSSRHRTTSEAYVLSGHTAVIFLDSHSGCVSLDHCIPLVSERERDMPLELQIHGTQFANFDGSTAPLGSVQLESLAKETICYWCKGRHFTCDLIGYRWKAVKADNSFHSECCWLIYEVTECGRRVNTEEIASVEGHCHSNAQKTADEIVNAHNARIGQLADSLQTFLGRQPQELTPEQIIERMRTVSERERSQSQPVETPEQIAKNKRENES